MTFSLNTIYLVAIVIGVTLVSMILHELMHGLTAYWLGDETAKDSGRLTLNPIKHIDPFLTILLPVLMLLSRSAGFNTPIFGGAKPVPFNPDKVKGGEWGAALVGIAGPLTNLVLAFICYILLQLLSPSSVNGEGSVLAIVLYYGLTVNLGFFAFNIIPIPPLDGSRVLYAVAPDGFRRVMEYIEHAGLMVVFLVVLFASPLLSNLLSIIISGVIDCFASITSLMGL